MIYIPDASFYQYRPEKDIDFEKMRTKTPGVILRAGQNTWKDLKFDRSWELAGRAGLKRGTYWFFDPRTKPKDQARLWAEITRGEGEMEYWADFERLVVNGAEVRGYDNPQYWYDFMEYSKEFLPGVVLGVYTGSYYWEERHDYNTPPSDYWKQYPLWIAHYGAETPRLPRPWTSYLLWQFTDNGNGADWGVASGNIDLNVFNGNFEERYGAGKIGHKIQAGFGDQAVTYKETA
jgi:lysozyme